MKQCPECSRLQEEIQTRAQARAVADSEFIMARTREGFSRASKAMDLAHRAWLEVVLEFQEHMRAHEGSDTFILSKAMRRGPKTELA